MKFLLFIVASFLLLTSNLIACEPDAGAFDWARCHSLLRYSALAALGIVSWLFATKIYFPSLLRSFYPGDSGSPFRLLNTALILFVFLLFIGFMFMGMNNGWEKVTYLKGSGKGNEALNSIVVGDFEWSTLVFLAVAFLLAFNLPFYIFSRKPMGSDIYYYSIYMFVFLWLFSYIVLFAGFGTEWRERPSTFFDKNWIWLNLHWRWLTLVLVFFLLSPFYFIVMKSKKRTDASI